MSIDPSKITNMHQLAEQVSRLGAMAPSLSGSELASKVSILLDNNRELFSTETSGADLVYKGLSDVRASQVDDPENFTAISNCMHKAFAGNSSSATTATKPNRNLPFEMKVLNGFREQFESCPPQVKQEVILKIAELNDFLENSGIVVEEDDINAKEMFLENIENLTLGSIFALSAMTKRESFEDHLIKDFKNALDVVDHLKNVSTDELEARLSAAEFHLSYIDNSFDAINILRYRSFELESLSKFIRKSNLMLYPSRAMKLFNKFKSVHPDVIKKIIGDDSNLLVKYFNFLSESDNNLIKELSSLSPHKQRLFIETGDRLINTSIPDYHKVIMNGNKNYRSLLLDKVSQHPEWGESEIKKILLIRSIPISFQNGQVTEKDSNMLDRVIDDVLNLSSVEYELLRKDGLMIADYHGRLLDSEFENENTFRSYIQELRSIPEVVKKDCVQFSRSNPTIDTLQKMKQVYSKVSPETQILLRKKLSAGTSKKELSEIFDGFSRCSDREIQTILNFLDSNMIYIPRGTEKMVALYAILSSELKGKDNLFELFEDQYRVHPDHVDAVHSYLIEQFQNDSLDRSVFDLINIIIVKSPEMLWLNQKEHSDSAFELLKARAYRATPPELKEVFQKLADRESEADQENYIQKTRNPARSILSSWDDENRNAWLQEIAKCLEGVEDSRTDLVFEFLKHLKPLNDQAFHVLQNLNLCTSDRLNAFLEFADSHPAEQRFNAVGLLPYYVILPSTISEPIEALFSNVGPVLGQARLRPEYVDEVHRLLIQDIENHIDDKDYLVRFIENLQERWDSLGIVEESPLEDKLIEVQAIISAEGEGNPYAIHKRLLATSTEPLLDLEMPAYEVPVPADGGQTSLIAAFSLDKVRETARTRSFKIDDIPDECKPQVLKGMFEALEARIQGLDADAIVEVEQFIQGSTGGTLEMLKAGFLDKPFIKAMMRDYKPDEKISFHMYKLACLIQSTLRESNDVEASNDPLSPREDRLIKLAASINFCSTGQRDGIDLVYNMLSPQERYLDEAHRDGGAPTSSPVETIIRDEIQRGFADAVSLPAVEMLLGTKDIAQPSHQTEYLGNRIRRQVGFNKELTFDRHSQTISPQLLQADPKDLVEAVYKTYPFAQLVTNVRKAINEQFFEKEGGIDNKTRNDLTGRVEDTFSCFDVDEDTYELKGINERGVLEVMQSLGYITFSEASEQTE